MKQTAGSLLATLVLAVGLATPGLAEPFADGYAAYLSGDYATAKLLLRPLAEKGHAPAQFFLGNMYGDGDDGAGVPPDDAEAAKWFRLAAERGAADAQFNLGIIYRRGRGVPQDHVQAHMWFDLAAARGAKQAAEWRDRVAANMTPDQIATAQRLAREWRR